MNPVMIQNSNFDNWLNVRRIDPTHPLCRHLRKFSELGADPDVIFPLCCMLACANVVRSCLIETEKRLADRKRRWRKEFQGLLSSHPGKKLRLTNVARIYSFRLILSTIQALKGKGLINPTTNVDISYEDEGRSIIQQALEPLADMKGFPEDWDAAINESDYSGTSNLLTAVGLAKITPELGEWVEKLVSLFWPSIFMTGGTKRRDDAGTFFLLFVTQHLRKATKKPRFELAFNLMNTLRPKHSGRVDYKRQSAAVRVSKLKKQWPQWQAEIRRFEQMVQSSKASLSIEKVN
jgi:hypothetical protein